MFDMAKFRSEVGCRLEDVQIQMQRINVYEVKLVFHHESLRLCVSAYIQYLRVCTLGIDQRVASVYS